MKYFKINIFWVFLAVLLGIWSYYSFATFFVFFASIFLLVYLSRYFEKEERIRIMAVIFSAFFLRLLVAFIYYYYNFREGFGIDFFGDARGYSHSGLYISYILKGMDFLNFPYYDNSWSNSLVDTFYCLIDIYRGSLPPPTDYRTGFFPYFLGAFYTLLGYSPFAFRILNSLVGVLVGVFIYFITKRLFGKDEAFMSMGLTLFFPTLLYWSITGLKDIILTFCITFSMLIFLKLKERIRVSYLVLAMVLLTIFNLIFSGKFFIVFSLIFFAFVLVSKKIRLVLKIFIIVLLIGGYLLLLSHFGRLDILQNITSLYSFENLISTHVGIINTGGGTYKIYPDYCYLLNDYRITFSDFWVAYLIGLAHVFFAPFPWAIESPFQAIVFPEVMFSFFIFPFFILGLIRIKKIGISNVIEILLFMFFYISVLSVAEGNVGTLYRHKSIMLPFFFLFASAGFVSFRKMLMKNNNEKLL